MGRLLCHLGGVGCGREAGTILDRTIGETGQRVSRVLANGHAQLVAAFDDAEDGGDPGSSFLAAQMQPIAPANRNRPHRVFSPIRG